MMNVGDCLKDLIKPLYLLLVPYVALLIFLFTLILTIVFTWCLSFTFLSSSPSLTRNHFYSLPLTLRQFIRSCR